MMKNIKIAIFSCIISKKPMPAKARAEEKQPRTMRLFLGNLKTRQMPIKSRKGSVLKRQVRFFKSKLQFLEGSLNTLGKITLAKIYIVSDKVYNTMRPMTVYVIFLCSGEHRASLAVTESVSFDMLSFVYWNISSTSS